MAHARTRFTLRLGLVAALFLGLLAPLAAAPALAAAATPAGWDAGNIIADSLFWDGNAMNAQDVQGFLNSKSSGCDSGYTCLKDYRETTRTVPADPMCSQYAGRANESAAEIIAKVGQACGVSQKALLVILQKEQSLVTTSTPTPGSYRAAMGAGCPDTAACDSDYYGFFNQVLYGAYLLKRYTQPPGTGPGTEYYTRYDLRYPVGRVSDVLYNPDRSCGSLPVNIQNQATHALYIYTPYTPNAAALAAGSGRGDSCSAYGNRNFWLYYTNWFGSTQDPTEAYWRNSGGATGPVGAARGSLVCGNGGCYRDFQNGRISWSSSTGAWFVSTASQRVMDSIGGLGYPTSDQICGLSNTGCYQVFTGGALYTSATGTWPIRGGIKTAWDTLGKEWGAAGYPTSYEIVDNGIVYQQFERGRITWTATTGARFVSTASQRVMDSIGGLGYPTSDQLCGLANNGCYQVFTAGALYTSAAGTWPIRGGIKTAWDTLGKEWGAAGYPTSYEIVDNGIVYQQFERGRITWTATTGGVFTRSR